MAVTSTAGREADRSWDRRNCIVGKLQVALKVSTLIAAEV